MERAYWVYILANRRNGTLYVGMTSDLARRMDAHRRDLVPGFTRTYGVKHLVYAEPHPDAAEALARERRLKRWRRAWKIAMIESQNPDWRDLTDDIST